MPIHDVGYRGWRGSMVPNWLRWWTIGETGCQLVLRSAWVRRLVLLAWLPIMYWGAGFFFADRMITSLASGGFRDQTDWFPLPPEGIANVDERALQILDEQRQRAAQITTRELVRNSEMISGLPKIDLLVQALEDGDRSNARHVFWSWLLMTFVRYPQSLIVVFLLGFIVPPLIARDMRSRALLLYFSRPIGRREYLLGKLMVPAVFLAFVTMLPALALYAWGLCLAPDLTALVDTWDLPLRIIAAGVVLIVPTALLGLMLSSFTQESRLANFAWFAVWALGIAAWFAIVLSRASYLSSVPGWDGNIFEDAVVKSWAPVSLYLSLGEVQSWVFGFESFGKIWASFVSLLVVSLVSLGLLYRNISRTAHGP